MGGGPHGAQKLNRHHFQTIFLIFFKDTFFKGYFVLKILFFKRYSILKDNFIEDISWQ